MYVLDTNTLIYFFRGEGKVAQRMFRVPPGRIAVPAVVAYELMVGIAKSEHSARRNKQLAELLEVVVLLPFDLAAAECAAVVRAGLEKSGKGIGPLDTLIAGTALAHDGVLVTRNTREFGRVSGLRLENWY